jgi:hypothetical protein
MSIINKIKAYFLTAWRRLSGKKIGDEFYNVYHPDFAANVEKATDEKGKPFIVNGKQYYRFVKETNMKWGRYMYLQTFLHEQGLRLDTELLGGYMNLMEKALNGSINKGIELGQCFKIIGQIRSRLELAFEAETTYRLASVIYFDDTEDLYGYDKSYNDKKIAAWKEAKCVDFFYTRPMSELLGLSDLSPQDLVTYMEDQKRLLDDLTIETPAP